MHRHLTENEMESYWDTIINYAISNGFEVPEFMEELGLTYKVSSETVKEMKRDAQGNDEEFVMNLFSSLAHHTNWSKKHELDDALIHTHLNLLEKQNRLTDKEKKKLKLKCSDCSKCMNCGKKVNEKTARYINSNEFCRRFCEERGEIIYHRKGCRYYGM